MSFNIPLQAVPNQSLSVVVDGLSYVLLLKTAGSVTIVTVVRDNETLISSTRAVFGAPILPYLYLENGNFIFTCTTEDTLPIYTSFGVTQFLSFYTADELEALRNGNA
jgi:hypothetical protein